MLEYERCTKYVAIREGDESYHAQTDYRRQLEDEYDRG